MLAWTQWLSRSRDYPQDDAGRHTNTLRWGCEHTFSSHIIYWNLSGVEGRKVPLLSLSPIFWLALPSFFPFLFLCHAVKTGRMWSTRRLLAVPEHPCVHVFLFIRVCVRVSKTDGRSCQLNASRRPDVDLEVFLNTAPLKSSCLEPLQG